MPVQNNSTAALLSLLLAACAAAPDKPLVVPGAMGCESLPTEAERSAWLTPRAALTGAADADTARAVVTPIRTRVKLLPQARLKPLTLAKAEASPPDTFDVPKSLLFEVKAGRDYLLQITAASGNELDLLIAQAAK